MELRLAVVKRFARRLVLAAAAVCLLAVPAQAAIDADFNGDGVLDRVVLPRPPETNIVVRFSGAAPQVLKFRDRIIAIVATDINHDGEIDLSALSERRGVFIWLNKGKAGKGHLKALKRRHHSRGSSLGIGAPSASAPQSGSESPAAAGTYDDRDRSAQDESTTHALSQRATVDQPITLFQARPTDPGGASPSRAPPAALP